LKHHTFDHRRDALGGKDRQAVYGHKLPCKKDVWTMAEKTMAEKTMAEKTMSEGPWQMHSRKTQDS
jgi:hypothetical protein